MGRALFWCGFAVLIGILWLVFGSASDRFNALLLIPIALLTAFPFAVGAMVSHGGRGIGARSVRVAGYFGAGCLVILFGGSLLIFTYVWLFLAWQQASQGDYALSIVLAAIFGAIGVAFAAWWRARSRSRRNPPSSPTSTDPTDFSVYPPV